MNRTPVESSMISSVGFNPVKNLLEVEFLSGDVYQYGNVPEEVYRELMAADSKGSYMADAIIDQYAYGRVSRSRRRRRSS